MHFLTTKKYIEDLSAELYRAPKKIRIICFQILNDEMMQELKPSLIHALKNGSDLEIYADAIYSHHNVNAGFLPNFFSRTARDEAAKLKAHNLLLFNELRSLGAHIHFINEPGIINKHLLPFTGRDHRKVIQLGFQNERIIYFGAANFGDYSTNDYMIKVNEPEIVEAINSTVEYINDHRPENDLIFDCTETCTILMDRGKPLQSIIYDEGIKLIRSAKKRIVYVSQLPPEPSILQHLIHASKRDVVVDIIIPGEGHPQISGFPFNIAFRYAALQCKRNNIKIIHTSLGYTHAKVLLTDDIVLVGSHNLSFTGIMSGTVELSAEITDKAFITEVEKFINLLR